MILFVESFRVKRGRENSVDTARSGEGNEKGKRNRAIWHSQSSTRDAKIVGKLRGKKGDLRPKSPTRCREKPGKRPYCLLSGSRVLLGREGKGGVHRLG